MDILGLIRRLPEIVAYNKFDDDFFDRLNYSHTVAILTVFAIIVTNRQFSDNQIKCWVPAQFTGSYEQYVNQICFITNTYSFDMHESLPDDVNRRHEHELKYYQWTPFILLLMAILFYIPHQFWRALSLRSGVDIKDLIEAAYTYRSSNIRHEDKLKLLAYLSDWLNAYCSNTYRLSTPLRKQSRTSRAKLLRFGHHLFFPTGIYTGNYLIISYLFIKCLYLINSIGQILLLNALLGRQFLYYGFEMLHRYWTKEISLLYAGNEYFPKVVLCDFTVREPNHPKESHRYTVQCVLPFNLFNQQIFTYLYFWLLILSCFNAASIIMWLYRMTAYRNFHYLDRRLTLHFLTDEHNDEQELRRVFVHHYLQGDGTFMLRLLASNVSDYVCTKIILELYKTFHAAILNDKIHRESLFIPIAKGKSDDDDDDGGDDDGSTDQTVTGDIPPVPNPRQGKIFVEHDPMTLSSSDGSFVEQNEAQRTVSFSVPISTNHRPVRSHSSPRTPSKDLRRSLITPVDSHEQKMPREINDFHLRSDTTPLSTPPSTSTPSPPSSRLLPQPLFPSSMIKGPSPYATTYLATKKRSEHELPYIDDSISSGSVSRRSSNALVVRQSDKPTTTLLTSALLFQRTHDV